VSGLNEEDDDSLDDVNSLIRMIKGTKKNEEVLKSKEATARSQTPSGGQPPSDIGDFAILQKKMSMPVEEEAPTTASSIPDNRAFSGAGSQQKKNYQPSPTSQSPPAGSGRERGEKDSKDSIEKLLAGGAMNQPQVSRDHFPKNQKENEIEIIDEDPKEVMRPKSIKSSSIASEIEPVTDADKKIVNVDQISDFSGLILPKGVSFKIDELKLHGRISAFEGTGTLPPDFDEIWKKNFSTAGFKDLDIEADIGL
jgi:flagellar protein FlaI